MQHYILLNIHTQDISCLKIQFYKLHLLYLYLSGIDANDGILKFIVSKQPNNINTIYHYVLVNFMHHFPGCFYHNNIIWREYGNVTFPDKTYYLYEELKKFYGYYDFFI